MNTLYDSIDKEIEINKILTKNIKLKYTNKELYTFIKDKKTTFEKAQENIKWCFDNFEHICVSTSGGKDSSVLLDMCLKEAEIRDRQIHLFYLDEEFELNSSIDLVKEQMEYDRVIKHWYCPNILMDCAYRKEKPYVEIWDKSREFFHSPPPYAIFNNFNAKGFNDFEYKFYSKMKEHYGNIIFLNGMTSEESLKRLMVLKTTKFFFGKTWLSLKNKIFKGSPLETMTIHDIFLYIALNGVKINDFYKKNLMYGKKLKNVRVSSLLHEQTISNIDILQEVAQDDYNHLVEMLNLSINDTNLFYKNAKERPSCFGSWYEYAIFLIDYLGNNKQKWLDLLKTEINHARYTLNYENNINYASYLICMRIFIGDIKGSSAYNNSKRQQDSYERWIKQNNL